MTSYEKASEKFNDALAIYISERHVSETAEAIYDIAVLEFLEAIKNLKK